MTDSFHGVAFAILFNKPFIVIGNRERGLERFISLLKMFNLSSRLVNNVECVRELMEAKIDFAPVNAKLEAMRAVSLNFYEMDLNNKILSIIVPVYNVEQYISGVLGFFVQASVDEGLYEVVVVNDGTA